MRDYVEPESAAVSCSRIIKVCSVPATSRRREMALDGNDNFAMSIKYRYVILVRSASVLDGVWMWRMQTRNKVDPCCASAKINLTNISISAPDNKRPANL